MTKSEIIELINNGPGQKVEFIKGLPAGEKKAKEMAKLMAAFANTNDGTILLGVDEKTGAIVGIDPSAEFRSEIENIDKRYCDPPVIPEILSEEVDGRLLAVINISKGAGKPFFVDSNNYIRRGRNIYLATHGEIQEMYKKRSNFKLEKGDEWPVEGATYEDLDPERVDEYIEMDREKTEPKDKSGGSKKEFLRQKRVLTEIGGMLLPTAGGLLMFGKRPQNFLFASGVRIARFMGKDTGSIILDQREIKGTIPQMIDDTEQFIVKHMEVRSKINGFKRDDFTEYPLVAVREAITNAIVHRDYTVDSSQTRILIFDDRIEVYTPGGLPDGITIDNIERAQYSRNRVIAGTLIGMGRYIEKLGTGIRRMKQAVRACGLREPKLFDTGIDFVVILFGPADKEEHIKKQERLGRIHLTMDSVKTPQAAAHRGEVSERAENGGGLIRAYPDHGSGIRSRRERKDEKRISFKWIISVMLSSAVILSIIVSHGRHNNPAFRYNSASLLHANNEYYGAIEAYRRFLKRFPADKKAVDAQYYMAGCYEMLEDNMKALNAYDELINKYPSSQWAVYARYWRGGIYTRLNRFDDAITEYQKISQGYPDHTLAPEALYGIALAYQKQGEFEKAIDGYEKLLNLKLYSSDGQEYYQMALCYLGLGQPEKAKDALQDVVSGENADPELVKKATEKIKELERAQDTTWNKRPIIKSEK